MKWNKTVFLTFDVDWACNEVFDDTINLIKKENISSTFFITHETKILDRLRNDPKIELGIHPNFNKLINKENVNCIITSDDLVQYIPINFGVLVCDNPKIQFFKIHNCISNSNLEYKRKKFKTQIGVNCKMSSKSFISENNVVIGDNVIIEDNAIIKNDVTIGNETIIRSGAIIGGEGFEFKRNGSESVFLVTHCGGVKIGENVEIQYNSCVDKAIFPWDNTIIGNHSKIDNLVHVGHAAKIGDRCLLAANACIGGSTVIGNDCWIGVGATISNGILIGDKCRANIGAVVTKNIESGRSVSGNFAIEHSKFIKFIKSIM